MESDSLINLFVNEHGNYNRLLQFNVIISFILILFCFSKIFGLENSMYIIILIVFGIYITNSYVKSISNQVVDTNKLIYLKLQNLQEKMYEFIQYKINNTTIGNQKISNVKQEELFAKNKLDALYIDSNLIEFLYSIISLYDYNPNEFYLLITGTNNILKLQLEIEQLRNQNGPFPENIQEMLKTAIQLRTNCMNNIQNFIYSVPKIKIMYKYIDTVSNTYYSLITQHIKQINIYYKLNIKQNGINSMTSFININENGDFANDFDTIDNHSVIPSKFNNHKFVDLFI
jgi:hypothetical protein